MEEQNIKPSDVTFNVAITACGNGGQWKKALELLSVMRKRQIPINLYVYNAAITALSKAAKKSNNNFVSNDHNKSSSEVSNSKPLYIEAMKLLDEMKHDGIEPDGFSFSSAISCCGSEGHWEEALKLIQTMRQGGPNMQPNKVAYTAAITSCGRSGQADYAIQLFRQMIEQGLRADSVAYNSLFLALRISKRSNEAFEFWDEMLNTTKGTTTGSYYLSAEPDIITVTEYVC
jgi:pentatricopeptide repeat protein